MWSEKYNPVVCFDALYSTSEGQRLENLENLESCSGSRIALPGGGYIDLPGIDSSSEHEETVFPSDMSFQTTEQLGSSSGLRVALPGGGYIDLPAMDSLQEQDEHMHTFDTFHNNSGSRIELPGGGFIDLPGLESPSEQEEQTFASDIFQDYGLLEENKTVDQQDYVSSLLTSLQSLDFKLAQKNQIIIQQERENKRLREHLSRFMRIVTDRNFELHNLRNEASGVIRDLSAWSARLDRRTKSLLEKIDKMDETIAALISEAISVPLLRRLLQKGKKEREDLQEKFNEMEKSNQDLMIKNNVLEHELTVIPNEMISRMDDVRSESFDSSHMDERMQKDDLMMPEFAPFQPVIAELSLSHVLTNVLRNSGSKSFTKAEVHSQETYHVSSEPTSDKDNDQSCSTTTVSEQKTSQVSKADDPEQILVLQSQLIPPPENKAENILTKAKKVLTLSKWRRNETSKTQSQLHTDSLKQMN